MSCRKVGSTEADILVAGPFLIRPNQERSSECQRPFPIHVSSQTMDRRDNERLIPPATLPDISDTIVDLWLANSEINRRKSDAQENQLKSLIMAQRERWRHG